ncbi:MAG: PorT family protein [Cyclobacteriaceae bacterium]|nr:PorT family protein [Cyclobacteriaceae bacterium]
MSFLFLLLGMGQGLAQNKIHENLGDYDEQWIHYGFLIGVHQSKYKISYSDAFVLPQMDSLHSIVPGNLGGFKLGFVVNMFMFQYLDFRILPTVGFYENDLTYRYTDGSSYRLLKDATMMELPLLLKYKSVRRENVAMYLVGGINPSLEAAGKGDEVTTRENLELRNFNVSFDVGAGFDLYYPMFKFSPEIRYSFGGRNMLTPKKNEYSVNLDELVTHNIAIFITFEGGPNYLKKRKKKQ